MYECIGPEIVQHKPKSGPPDPFLGKLFWIKGLHSVRVRLYSQFVSVDAHQRAELKSESSLDCHFPDSVPRGSQKG